MNKNKFQDFRRSPDTSDNVISESLGKASLNKIYVGIVKDNRDVERMGRLRVYIPELGGQPSDELKWFTVDYCSPFAGATNLMNSISGSKSYTGTQQSYGFWAIPPDLENLVVVAFINGEPNRGIWFGCLYQQFMNNMVPGIAGSKVFSDTNNNSFAPAAEYNKKTQNLDPNNPTRAEFLPLSKSIVMQGLTADSERGISRATARRESPSQVFGIKTPRGHHIYIDDGEIEVDPLTKKPIIQDNEIKRKENSNEYIRIRTRSGVQILINDTTGYIYMNTKDGNVWLELSDQNGVEIYSKENFNLRTERDINIHSDKNINFYAESDINFRSNGSLSFSSREGFDILSEGYYKIGSESYDLSTKTMAMKAGKKISIESGDVINLNSAKILQNTVSGEKPDKPVVKKETIVNNVRTIVDILPTHEPYKGHPKKLYKASDEQVKFTMENEKRGAVKSSDYSGNKSSNNFEKSQFSEEILKISDCDYALAEKYESRGNPGAVNDGNRDLTGGYSYGSVQIATKTGSMDSFLKYLEKEKPEYAKELNEAGGAYAAKIGDPAFINKWKEISRKDPKGFDSLQKGWNSTSNYAPVKNVINKKYGIDFEKDRTLSAVLYSTSTQHGSNGASKIFDRAVADIPPDKVKDLPREELIKRIYAERGKIDESGKMKYFSSSTTEVQNSVKNRFIREEKDALKMLELEKENKLPCQKDEI